MGEHGVDAEVCLERVAGLGEIEFRREQQGRGGQRQALVSRAKNERGRQIRPGRYPRDDDLARFPLFEQRAIGGDAVVEPRGIGVVGRHPVVDRPGVHPEPRGGEDAGRAAALAATGNQPSAVDVQADPGIVWAGIGRGDGEDPGVPDADVPDHGPGGIDRLERGEDQVVD